MERHHLDRETSWRSDGMLQGCFFYQRAVAAALNEKTFRLNTASGNCKPISEFSIHPSMLYATYNSTDLIKKLKNTYKAIRKT